MHLQDREFQKRRFTHYLRTGRREIFSKVNKTKYYPFGAEKKTREKIRQILRNNKPNGALIDHYFYGEGRTFDLVARNLLSYVTRSRAFREARADFKEKIFHHLRIEARERCGTDQTRPTVKFTRRFSDRQPVDFTAEFFSLGNSYLAMTAEVTAQADCFRKRINLKGYMTFEINDRFADPVDIFDWWNNDIEIPGGTPFPIRARWSDSLSESGSF